MLSKVCLEVLEGGEVFAQIQIDFLKEQAQIIQVAGATP